ncbi:MAG: oligosaccharide flippase family protein [Pseudomonadota bacterium]
MASLTQKAGLLIALNLFKYAVGFLLPVALVRLLSKDEYGTYQQLLLIGSLSVGVMTLGFPASIYYYYKQYAGEPRQRAFVLQVALLFLASGLVTAVIVYFARDVIADNMNNSALSGYLEYYSIYLLFFVATEYFIHLLISKDLYSLGVKIESAEVLFRVALLMLPLVSGFGLQGLVISLAIYAVFRFCFYTIVIRHDLWPLGAGVLKLFTFKEQLVYSLPLAMSFLLGLIGRTIDKFLISINFTPSQMAVYAVGAVEIPLDVIFQASVANVLRADFPALAKNGQFEEMIRIWRAAVRKLALIILPIFIFLMGFSSTFITFMFTDKYQDSVDIFRIYLLLVPLHMVVLSIFPQVFGNTKLTMKIVMVSASFNIISSIILVKAVGYYGPALATVVTNYLSAGLYMYFALRLLKCDFRTLVPLRTIVRVAASAVIGVVLASMSVSMVGSKLFELALGGIVFLITYVVLLLALSEVSKAEIQSIWQEVRRRLPVQGAS